MSALLKFQDVSYWYSRDQKKVEILKKINIDFEKGTFYTITGPSGAGKSTFLALAGALDSPKEGSILYEGKDLKKIGYSKFRNQYVSIVFQSYNLLPYMTALQNVVAAMEITKSSKKPYKQIALKTLEQMGISQDQAKQKVLTLSGGQQQRVSIARALCCESQLIVADEPTGNLDEQTSKEIVRIFQDLAHQEGKCVIMVTHDLTIASIADVNIHLSNGTFQIQ
ncbi:ABC transporter ATP-binding protein [Aeribacillus pallidus]|jgi:putative ABC transport system ATP-binding protein|uniref:ABC transporter ATP-binding protein n=1 Tax=Aeribacillus TaxID=1055323 RepID=UPI0007B49E3B|nr:MULTISPECIES: ABC transporter ATP-binding protein [Aeribacillus]KZM57429.1 ABC transporter [Aeribacillus pallidus]MED0650270.1 ABC transporter ATP-binding protein [Aeribacillus composti]MED4485578.1 ABC transporter ATP-binding protein [Aeribacillus pallidus]RZI50207.1 ABC transporter ATP-binding protein [Aeribacillus pallidus]